MKKITCILILLTSVLFTCTVQAADLDSSEGEIVPSYVGLRNMSADLAITSIGKRIVQSREKLGAAIQEQLIGSYSVKMERYGLRKKHGQAQCS